MSSIKSQMRCLALAALFAVVAAHPIDENTQNVLFELGYIDLSHYGDRIFGDPDASTGERLAQYDPAVEEQNPEELGSYLEGDILMPLGQARNGLSASGARWPNAIIPYEINGNFDAFQMNMIETAFNEYHSKTCIRFQPRSNEQDYIVIQNSQTGCWSSVGRIGGRQEVNFQTPGCMTKIGTVIHELMHASGFLHEQNREERDGYVSIAWNNVKSGTENNFEKARPASTNAFGVNYDYGSVMHYSSNAFSKNGQPTIIAKNKSSATMGQRDGFSKGDIEKLNAMYKCPADKQKPAAAPAAAAATNKPLAAIANTIANSVKPSTGNKPARRPLVALGNLLLGRHDESNEV